MANLFEMLSDTKACSDDVQRLNVALISEKDAINLYTQLAQQTDNPLVAEILLDIAKEEKVHVGELLKCITIIDPEYAAALKDGANEVDKFSKEQKSSKSEDSESEDEEEFDDEDDIDEYV